MSALFDWNYQFNNKEIREYLIQNQWQLFEHPNTCIEVFKNLTEDSDSTVKLVLPKDETVFKMKSNSLVETLCGYYGLTPSEIKANIANTKSDLFFDKITNEGYSCIPLDLAAKIINVLHGNSLKSAKIEKQRLMLDNRNGSVNAFAETAKFGHTFHGSFGFSIIIPLPGEYQQTIHPESDAPFERKVGERLSNTFLMTALAVDSKSIEPFIQNMEDAPTSSMCSSMAKIWERSNVPIIEHSARWAKSFPVSEEKQSKSINIILTAESKPLLIKASETLKKESKPTPAVVYGRIPDLHKDLLQSNTTNRLFYITILWEIPGKNPVHVKVELNQEDYKKAIQAHDDERIVQVNGQLKRGAPYYRLLKAGNFKIL